MSAGKPTHMEMIFYILNISGTGVICEHDLFLLMQIFTNRDEPEVNLEDDITVLEVTHGAKTTFESQV